MLQRKPESLLVLNYFDVVCISPQSKTLPQLRRTCQCLYTTPVVGSYSHLFKDFDRPGEIVKQG